MDFIYECLKEQPVTLSDLIYTFSEAILILMELIIRLIRGDWVYQNITYDMQRYIITIQRLLKQVVALVMDPTQDALLIILILFVWVMIIIRCCKNKK